MNSSPTPSFRLQPLSLFVLAGLLASCESEPERIARLHKEAAMWEGFWSTFTWVALAVIAAVVIYSLVRYFSAANVSARHIRDKKNYAQGLSTLLNAGDYHSLQSAIARLALPQRLQPIFDQAASRLTAVYMRFTDPRNTFVPPAVKADILNSTKRTFEGLFSTIQRIKIIQESHTPSSPPNLALEDIGENVQSISNRLDACLADSAALILQPIKSSAEEGKAEQGVASLENMLSALNDADRMLNT